MVVKNRAASTLARLKNQAKKEGISYQMCLQLFFQEEFLRRLSRSKYRENYPVYHAVLQNEDFDRQWFSAQKSWILPY